MGAGACLIKNSAHSYMPAKIVLMGKTAGTATRNALFIRSSGPDLVADVVGLLNN